MNEQPKFSPREHALRIAALEALREAVIAEYEAARAAAEPVFAALYAEAGNDRQAVLLPSGEKIGQLTIKAPVSVVDMPADALLDWCREHFPAAVEEYIDPAHAGSADVIAAVRDKLPDLIRQRVRPGTAKALTEEIVKGHGLLADRMSGEAERVATVTPGTCSGAFAFTDGKGAERRARILAELLAGRLPGVIGFGPVALPPGAVPMPERPVYVYRLDVTYPPGSREWGWEPPGWVISGPNGYEDDPGEFRWPPERLLLSASGAKRRAELFRSYGATVEIVRSERVTWAAGEPGA